MTGRASHRPRYDRIRHRARTELAEFENPDGVAAPLRGHVVVGHVR
ncbi:hypothetical protein [Myceligenerans halotolerans]